MENKEELRKLFHRKVIPKMVWREQLSEEDRGILKEWREKFNPNLNLLKFYTNKNILFEMVKYLGSNELIFHKQIPKGQEKIAPIRHLFASKVENLLFHIYFYKVLEEPKTVFCGLSNFKYRPVAPINLHEKKKWQREFWTGEKREYLNYIKSYNFGLDIDGKNFTESYKDAKKVFEFLKKFEIKFSIWCSGKKGWHLIIPYEEMEGLIGGFEVNKVVTACKGLMVDLVKMLKLKDVDYKIYSPSRYLKCCYTVDTRNGNIIYPLSDDEFRTFDVEYMTQEYLLKQKDLGFRGAYIDRPSNPKGFKDMILYIEEKSK